MKKKYLRTGDKFRHDTGEATYLFLADPDTDHIRIRKNCTVWIL